jgi:hypothetical protein
MDLTLISPLRIVQNESCHVQFEQLVNACSQYAFSLRARLNAAARLGPIMLKTGEESGPKTCVANRTFQDNPSTFQQALCAGFPIADQHLDICNAPLPDSNIGQDLWRFLGSARPT